MNLRNININVILVIVVAILSTFFIQTKNAVTVSGECLRKVVKDKASIELEVKNLDKDAAIATKKSNDTYKQISNYITALQKQYPEIELETIRYTTYEKKEWNQAKKKNEVLGIENTIELKITTTQMDLVTTILGEVSNLKDVYPNGLNTFISKELLKSEQDKCIKEAVLDAKSKANQIAESTDQSIGKMISAKAFDNTSADNYSYIPYKTARMESSMADTGAGAPAIFAGNEDISVSISASFELK